MLPGVTAFYLFDGLGRLEDGSGIEVNLGCIVRLGECLKVLFFFLILRRPFLHLERKGDNGSPSQACW